MRVFSKAVALAVLLAAVLVPALVKAGGGPENVLLVVNAESDSSKLIANWYIQGRKIPAKNVVYLTGVPARERIQMDKFQETILKPILQELTDRKLGNIDYIVYSADFPTMIHNNDHKDKLFEMIKAGTGRVPTKTLFLPMASISSLTYFAGPVMQNNPGYMLLDSNNYYRQPAQVILRKPFTGERQKEFAQATSKIDGSAEELQASIGKLNEMNKANPQQIAVAYWLAKFYAKSGDVKSATQWLQRSIQLGWCFKKQTVSDLAFGKAMGDPLFKGFVERIPDLPFDFAPTRGFAGRYGFGPNGFPNNEKGQGNRHFISTVLAGTRNYGNNEVEALRQLQITMAADESKPDGTFYFTDTKNVRSRTRKPNFQPAIDSLERMGLKTKVVTTDLPMNVTDIIGLTCGGHLLDWPASKSKIIPGAICENLTSYGGIFWKKPGQTTIADFVRNGAGGSAGTVTEPLAVQAKFPHPMIHAHYARGCSMGEAFYQSVHGPSQLLIVGDALCQPWATKPKFSITGVAAGETVSGKKELFLDISQSPVSIIGMGLYLDGTLVKRSPIRDKIAFDSKTLTDGFHELRVVAVASGPIETVNHVVLPLVVDNFGKQTSLTVAKPTYDFSEDVILKAETNFGDSIELFQNSRSLGKKKSKKAEFKISAKLLGRGPVKLTAVAISKKGNKVSSRPVEFEIKGPVYDRRDDTETPIKRRAKDGKMAN